VYILIFLRINYLIVGPSHWWRVTTYISEHAPHNKRGFYTSFIQITATLGMLLSLAVILIFRVSMGSEKFASFGWRFPFLLSILLLAASIYIRLKLDESPMFQKKKDSDELAKNPLVESFTDSYNLKYVLLALIGATMGQGVVWYCGQFYALFFIQTVLKTLLNTSYLIVGTALLFASPFFILGGWLSDKYGRKPFMVGGIFMACATWYPLFMGLHYFRHFQDTAGKIASAIYNPYMMCFLVWIMVLYVALVYGPIAAFLVELFPTRIRYTSMSFPYHIGNGVFGGLVPVIGTAVQTASGNTFGGIWYPLGVAGICLIVMIFFIPETYHVYIDEYEHPEFIREKA
jgi:MFS family permease